MLAQELYDFQIPSRFSQGFAWEEKDYCGYASSRQAGFALQSKAQESKEHSGAKSGVIGKKPHSINRRESLKGGRRESLTSPHLGPEHSVRHSGVRGSGFSNTQKRPDNSLKLRRNEGSLHRNRKLLEPDLTPACDVPPSKSFTASLKGLQRDVSQHDVFTWGKSASFQVWGVWGVGGGLPCAPALRLLCSLPCQLGPPPKVVPMAF